MSIPGSGGKVSSTRDLEWEDDQSHRQGPHIRTSMHNQYKQQISTGQTRRGLRVTAKEGLGLRHSEVVRVLVPQWNVQQ